MIHYSKSRSVIYLTPQSELLQNDIRHYENFELKSENLDA